MNSDTVIRVEGLSKKYLIGHREERYVTLRDVVAQRTRAIWHMAKGRRLEQPKAALEEFWALNDVSFEIRRGEVLGIIGRNGAGKSTLLKILSRITEPTKGRATIRGRVASLLEVGTGFHPELTGRENIFLNGTILGMTREEIKRRFDEIVAFAEVEKFIDTPVKRYSSGMNVRLGFAVAAHLDPEILIVDEVLAVGDLEFQKRSLGKIDMIAHSGRTVLFVSHNMPAVAALCTRGLVLDKGRLIADGDIAKAISTYSAQATGYHSSNSYMLYERTSSVISDAAVMRVEMFDGDGGRLTSIVPDQSIIFRLHYWNRTTIPQCSLILELRSMAGPILLMLQSDPKQARAEAAPGNHSIDCYVDHLPLAPGQYLASFGVAVHSVRNIDWADDAAVLLVKESDDLELQPAPSSNALATVRHRWSINSGNMSAPADDFAVKS
jgi:lipopolysaccharide transport system ATP-binding protein